jgi:hypothetical protein
MSEDRGNGADTNVISLADRMYPHLRNGESGELGESGYDTARRLQQEGIAKPANSLFGDQNNRPTPTDRGRETREGPAFDPRNYTPPEGYEVDPTLMGEFAQMTREFGLDQRAGEKALDFYKRSIETGEQRYIQQLEANVGNWAGSLPARDVEAARELLQDPDYTPAELRDWVVAWGSRHPSFAKMLAAWGGAAARGRRW